MSIYPVEIIVVRQVTRKYVVVLVEEGGPADVCSACSNDDPRPEIAGGFAISSRVNGPVFAFGVGARRRHYRTLLFLRNLQETAFLQGFVRAGKIRKSAETYEFAPLRKRAIGAPEGAVQGEFGEAGAHMSDEAMRRESDCGFCEPIEIRVSADAIIEVHSVNILARSPSLYRSSIQLRASRVARAIAGYALFGAAAALVIWFLLK
jgi:hypothetical protein